MPYGIGSSSPPPQRGWPGGWRDWWEADEEAAAAQVRAARFREETERVRVAWCHERKPTFGRLERQADPEPRTD